MASSSNSHTVSSSISASCSTSQCEYDVFLSFRGEDTRNNFTDHLFHALDGQGISVFRDTEELRRGQLISRDLFKAIETSSVAIMVLSQHYASSTWCLKELAKIMERWEAGPMKVLPIFYHVDPSVVRHQRGTFGDAFVKHDEGSKKNKEEVQSWRKKSCCQGAQAIKGIMLNSTIAEDNPLNAGLHMRNSLQETEQIELKAEYFSTMSNLKLLKICNVKLPGGLGYLPNTLRVMEWHRYPLPSLPRTFWPQELVELIMHDSYIKKLPEGFKFDRLKFLDFKDSKNLVKTPNFNELPNLKEVIFQGCTRLTEVHPSIGSHKTLIRLNMKDCKCLRSFPCEINIESLETFILSGCSSLKTFPDIGPRMIGLLNLYLDETAIEQLPSTMERLSGLTCLDLQNCRNVFSFPDIIWSLTSLKTLNLSGFRVQQPKSRDFVGLSSLAAAMVVLCTNCLFGVQHPEPQPNILLLKSLPELSLLESLDLSDCNLEDGALPDDLRCFSSLRSFDLSRNKFTSLPDRISQLSQLETFRLLVAAGFNHCHFFH